MKKSALAMNICLHQLFPKGKNKDKYTRLKNCTGQHVPWC